MKEHPILFSTPMVKAILEGKKTETRRTRNLDKVNINPSAWEYLGHDEGLYSFRNPFSGRVLKIKCPYGQVGDRLWVRETWAIGAGKEGELPNIQYKTEPWCITVRPEQLDKAREIAKKYGYGTWRPSIFMFRWASRHLLELVEEPIPQRLWDITEEDAKAEGIEAIWEHPNEETNKALRRIGAKEVTEPYIIGYKNYASLWDSLNVKKYPWAGNYWDWKLVFKEIKLDAS